MRQTHVLRHTMANKKLHVLLNVRGSELSPRVIELVHQFVLMSHIFVIPLDGREVTLTH